MDVLHHWLLQGSILAVGGLITALWATIISARNRQSAKTEQLEKDVHKLQHQVGVERQRMDDHLAACAERMGKMSEEQHSQWDAISDCKRRQGSR